MEDMVVAADGSAPAEASPLPDGHRTVWPRASWQPADAPVTGLPAVLARIEQLEQALVSNRAISMAVGILMERHHVGADTALAEMRRISPSSNVRLAVVATTLLEDHT